MEYVKYGIIIWRYRIIKKKEKSFRSGNLSMQIISKTFWRDRPTSNHTKHNRVLSFFLLSSRAALLTDLYNIYVCMYICNVLYYAYEWRIQTSMSRNHLIPSVITIRIDNVEQRSSLLFFSFSFSLSLSSNFLFPTLPLSFYPFLFLYIFSFIFDERNKNDNN